MPTMFGEYTVSDLATVGKVCKTTAMRCARRSLVDGRFSISKYRLEVKESRRKRKIQRITKKKREYDNRDHRCIKPGFYVFDPPLKERRGSHYK